MAERRINLQHFASVVDSEAFARILEKRLRKVFFDSYLEIEEQYGKVFKVGSSDSAQEEDFHVDGLGLWDEKEPKGPINYETIDPSFAVFYTHVEFAKGAQVERKLVDDKKYDIIDKIPKSMGRTGRATVEINAANILNHGFDPADNPMSLGTIGYDGVTLFCSEEGKGSSEGHELPKAPPGMVGNNFGAYELNSGNLELALLMARDTTDGVGLKIQCNPKKLIIPPALEFTALVLLNSAMLPGPVVHGPDDAVGYNDWNVLKNRLEPIVLDYLINNKAWFLQDTGLHEMNFFWRIKPEFNREQNFDTHIYKFSGYFRFSCGYSDWRGMLGFCPSAD